MRGLIALTSIDRALVRLPSSTLTTISGFNILDRPRSAIAGRSQRKRRFDRLQCLCPLIDSQHVSSELRPDHLLRRHLAIMRESGGAIMSRSISTDKLQDLMATHSIVTSYILQKQPHISHHTKHKQSILKTYNSYAYLAVASTPVFATNPARTTFFTSLCFNWKSKSVF